MMNSQPMPMRMLVASSLGIAIGLFALAAAFGLTGSGRAASFIALLAAGAAVAFFRRHPPVALDQTACSRGLLVVSSLATVVALVQLARLVVFIVAPSRTDFSTVPSSEWEVRHSCLSAYFIASNAARDVPNIYDDALYSLPDDNAAAQRKPRMIGPFRVDVYEYPPPFLLLPRALGYLVQDFTRYRMLWFALNAGVVLASMLAVARFMGPAAGTRALLLSPLVWAALPTLGYLQKGNVQGLIVASAMLAMVLFERRRAPAGGALLAYATLSKLFPGLLTLYLLAQRRWRALAWTAAFSLVFLLVTLADLGPASYLAFLGHLPGLVGGEAFPAFKRPEAIAINFSIPGLVFKLKLFGVPGMSFGTMKIVGWLYTLVAVGATILAARRRVPDEQKPLLWLAIIVLATLRSPFLPQAYAALPPLWLLTLLAASPAPNAKTIALVLGAWIGLGIYWPLDWKIDPRLLASINLVPQAITVVVAFFALRHPTIHHHGDAARGGDGHGAHHGPHVVAAGDT